MSYIARFKYARGQYLVEREAYSYGGQRIIGGPDSVKGRKQWEAYHNPPDRETGIWLNEMYRSFAANELVSIRQAPPCPPNSFAADVIRILDSRKIYPLIDRMEA